MKNTQLLLLIILFTAGAIQARETVIPNDKLLIDYKLLYTYTQDSLRKFYEKRNIPEAISPIRYDVDMYEVSYWGKWIDDSYVKAKGVLMVPKTDEALSEMAYCHGTRMAIKEKRGLDDPEQLITVLHAADGYISYFPFYYGLGGGEGRHIYQHAQTEAFSVIYFIKACRNELLKKIGIKNEGKLFISGYSQGGHSAMAAHKYIESGQFKNITVTASAPLSGAFDMSGTQSKAMFKEYSSTYYLPYLMVSYKEVYPEISEGEVYDLFKSPYNNFIKEYFENPYDKDFSKLNKQLPNIASEMIIDSLLAGFETGENLFVKKMAENDLYDWKPEAPTFLCACDGDNTVLPENTVLAYNTMKEKGAKVYLKTFGKYVNHQACASFAIMYSKIFFDNIRADKKKVAKTPFKKRLMLNIGVIGANKKGKKKLKALRE